MWRVDYLTDNNGRSPVAYWLEKDLDKKTGAYIYDRLTRLEQHGFKLLETRMMRSIQGYGADFYEIKCSQYRIAIYFHAVSRTFFALHGFKKQRQRERQELNTAYTRLKTLRRRLDELEG